MNFDHIRFIVNNNVDGRKVETILDNGDAYFSSKEDITHIFFYFYLPKDVEKVEVDGMDYFDLISDTYMYIQEDDGLYGYSANIRNADIITEDGYELTGHVVYTDGTEETITITLYPAD